MSTFPIIGISLGGIDVGDHDRVVRLLTAERGRTAVLARGVRGGRKKALASALEPGTEVRLELARGRGPLPLVRDASVQAGPTRARSDLDRLALLAYGLEIVSSLAPEDHEAHKLHRLLLSWLTLLDGEDLPGTASRQALEAKALTFAGLTPALVLCAVCGERLDAPAVFDGEVGGGAHGRHARGTSVEPEELIRFEALRRTPLADTPGVRPARPPWLLGDFVRWHLGRAVKSRDLLEELEGMG